jgi:dihydroorotate dehydrogenase electron transfer subunit
LLFAWDVWNGEQRDDYAFIIGLPGRKWEGFYDYYHTKFNKIHFVSEDGSLGREGNPVTCLDTEKDEFWMCGPVAMLKAINEKLKPAAKLLVSLEARMGCGFGGCLGCVVPTTAGPRRVCVEGPVFDGREIKWHDLP